MAQKPLKKDPLEGIDEDSIEVDSNRSLTKLGMKTKKNKDGTVTRQINSPVQPTQPGKYIWWKAGLT